MRRAASLLSIVSLAAVLFACSEDVAKAPAAKSAKSGEALFASQGCALCHAANGAGTTFGPTLLGKKQHWTRETLVLYFKNPVEYAAKDARLHEQATRYSLPMSRFDKLPQEELSALADHVLGLP